MNTVIIGNSGSGKTWLAKRLSAQGGVPVIHLDELFWQPGGFNVRRPQVEVAALIDDGLSRKSWIAEGVFGDLVSHFLPFAQVLIWLDLPWPVCQLRLEARGADSKAHMGRQQSAQGLSELMAWASAYPTRSGTCSWMGHQAVYSEFAGKKFRFTHESEAVAYCAGAHSTSGD